MDIVPKKVKKRVVEDRISCLPDETIHHVLSFLDVQLAVQTSLLSKRWKRIWATLPHLSFHASKKHTKKQFFKLVNGVISKRDRSSSIYTLVLDFGQIQIGKTDFHMIRRIVEYPSTKNAYEIRITGTSYPRRMNNSDGMGKLIPPSTFSSTVLKKLTLVFYKWEINGSDLSLWNLPALEKLELHNCTSPEIRWHFPLLKVLELHNCDLPIMSWIMPRLISLHLNEVTITGAKSLNLQEFLFLDSLTVCGNKLWSATEHVDIISQTISKLRLLIKGASLSCKFTVSAPNVSTFEYEGSSPLLFSSNEGLPGLERVLIAVKVDKFGWLGSTEPKKHEFFHNLFGMFHMVREAKCLTLSLGSIEVLSWALNFSDQPSPFVNLHRLKLKEGKGDITDATLPDHVKCYLVKEPQFASIVVQDANGTIRDYKPKAQEGPANAKADEEAITWEGHQVFCQSVPLLKKIKKYYPETFDQFKCKTKDECILALNTLCKVIDSFLQLSTSRITAPMFSSFESQLIDLKIGWGFNMGWLEKRLNVIEEVCCIDYRIEDCYREARELETLRDEKMAEIHEVFQAFEGQNCRKQSSTIALV